MTGQFDEVKAEFERIFPRALAVLRDELNQRYSDRVAALDKEAAALAVEYAGIVEEAQKLATVLPSLGREAQREADRLVLAGDHGAAGVKLAELREAEKMPLAMEQRQKEISDRYDRIPAEKIAIAQKVYEQMYPEMQAVVRPAEKGFFVCLLDGLARVAEDFQQMTGSAQNPILQFNRLSALTADERSPEWQSAQRWY
jgi:hypothetical protein